jgi:hypothetical protein|tara:strand:- start:261 stop:461 length:201 start_codon:yes stop_codon:yes gene_type:complete
MKTKKTIAFMQKYDAQVVTPKSLARCRQQKRKQGWKDFPKTRLWLKTCWERGVSPSEGLDILEGGI